MLVAAQLLAFLLLPALLLRLCAGSRLGLWLSPVILAYVAGVLARNLGLPLRDDVTRGAVGAAVLLGIPLLLFPADFPGWLRRARTTALACGLSFLAMLLAACLSAPLFARRAGQEGWLVAGLLVATFTGSTPNMVAVAHGLGASPGTLALVTTTDFLVAGSFAFFLLSPGVRWLGRLLPPFPAAQGPAAPAPPAEPHPRARAALLTLGVALPVAGLAGGLGLLAGEAAELVAISVATGLGVLGSLLPAVRRLPWSWALGEWFILVFCIGFGTLVDVRALLASTSSGWVLAWTAVVMLLGLALHLGLCRLAGIDRDTAVVTAAAAIYGPPFIGPVTTNLGNRELLLSGITAALAGMAVGTWLGVLAAWIARALG